MPTPPWATHGQLQFLEEVLPAFHSAQRTKTTSSCKTDIIRQFFERWPNEAAEAEEEPVATVLTKKQFRAAAKKDAAEVEGKAVKEPMEQKEWSKRRKGQIINWLNNNGVGAKVKGEKATPVVIKVVKKATRALSDSQTFSKTNFKGDIAHLVDEAQMKEPHRARIDLVRECTERVWAGVDESVREDIQERKRLIKESKKKAQEEGISEEEDEENTTENIAKAVMRLPDKVEMILAALAAETNWSFTVICGGPDPGLGGKKRALALHQGRDRYGQTFSDARGPAFKQQVLVPYLDWEKTRDHPTPESSSSAQTSDFNVITSASGQPSPLGHCPPAFVEGSSGNSVNHPEFAHPDSTDPPPNATQHPLVNLVAPANTAQHPPVNFVAPANTAKLPPVNFVAPANTVQHPPSSFVARAVTAQHPTSDFVNPNGATFIDLYGNQQQLSLSVPQNNNDQLTSESQATNAFGPASMIGVPLDPNCLTWTPAQWNIYNAITATDSNTWTPEQWDLFNTVNTTLVQATGITNSYTQNGPYATQYTQNGTAYPTSTQNGLGYPTAIPNGQYPSINPPNLTVAPMQNGSGSGVATSSASHNYSGFHPHGLDSRAGVIPMQNRPGPGFATPSAPLDFAGALPRGQGLGSGGVAAIQNEMQHVPGEASSSKSLQNHLGNTSSSIPLNTGALEHEPRSCDDSASSITPPVPGHPAVVTSGPNVPQHGPGDGPSSTPPNTSVPQIHLGNISSSIPLNTGGLQHEPHPDDDSVSPITPPVLTEPAGAASSIPKETEITSAENSERPTRNRRPPLSKEIPVGKQWLISAEQYLSRDLDTTEWKKCLRMWYEFEYKELIDKEVSSARLCFPYRPDPLGKWIKSRKYDAIPLLTDVKRFANDWFLWWNMAQPDWRRNTDTTQLPLPLNAGGANQDMQALRKCIRKAGPGGILSVLVGLKWWAEIRDEDDRWKLAVEDISACIACFDAPDLKRTSANGEEGNKRKKAKLHA